MRARAALLAVVAFGAVPVAGATEPPTPRPANLGIPAPDRPAPHEIQAGRILSPADHAELHTALSAARRGKWDRAVRVAGRSRNPLPLKLVTWLWLGAEDGKATYPATLEFFRSTPDWPRRHSFQQRLERRMPSDLPPAEILAFFEAHPPTGDVGQLRQAEALAALGQDEEAARQIRRIWAEAGLSPADERRLLRSFSDTLDERAHIERLDRMIWKRLWGSAQRQLRRVPPDHRLLGTARIRLARRQGGVDQAIERVPPDLRDHPGLVFERLRWRRRSGIYDRALELLVDLPDDLGRPSSWWYESRFLLRRLLQDKNWEQAYQLAIRHPRFEGKDRAEAAWLAGWIALEFLDRPQAARDHFQAMRETVRLPISVARGEYWLARTEHALGHSDLAARHRRAAASYPETYYGQRAIDQLGEKPHLPAHAVPMPAERTAYESREQVQILRMLAEADAEDFAKPFVIHLADSARSDAALILLHEICLETGMPHHAILAARRGVRSGRNIPRLLFPLPGPEAFPYSPKLSNTVPEALALAVANQESGFDPRARSPAGARGLMQLMPATARHAARKFKLPAPRGQKIEDPTYNLHLGTAVLAELLKRYEESLPLVLAAYNGGSRSVGKWIRRHGDPRNDEIDLGNWMELVPVAETRNYIQRVLEGMTAYRLLLEDSG